MGDVVTAILDAVRNADPDYGAATLEPVRPGDHVLGTLSDHARRIHAVRVLNLERAGAHHLEHRRIAADPARMQDARVTDDWIITSRILHVQAKALEALLHLAIFSEFPEAILHNTVEIRQGYHVVWSEHPARRTLGQDAEFNAVMSHDPSGRPS